MAGLTEICIFIEEYVKLKLFCSVQIIHKVDFPGKSKKAGKRGINGILNLSLVSEKTITFVCFILKKTCVQCYCTKLFIYCNPPSAPISLSFSDYQECPVGSVRYCEGSHPSRCSVLKPCWVFFFFFLPLFFSHATHPTSQEILLTLLSKAT